MSPRQWLAVLATMLLAGCAAQRALEEGESLIAGGHPADGLTKLQEAVQLEPTSARYRLVYLTHRDAIARGLVERGDLARVQGRTDEARSAFREALSILPGYGPALIGLRAVDDESRWADQLRIAEAMLARKEIDSAHEKLQAVLIESPHHAGARNLERRVDEAARKQSVEPALAASFRKPVSIEFKDAALRTVFDILSRTSGLNFVFDKEVRGDQRTSIYLRNSTAEAALNMLLMTNQLEMRVIDATTVFIYPASAAKLRDYQPLVVRSFYLSHAEAKTVAATIKAMAKSRDVVVDEKLNMVMVRDSPAAIRMAEKLVALHDIPEPEVMLEVEVLEVSRSRLQDLGVRLPDQLSLLPLTSSSGDSLTLNDLKHLNSTKIGATIGATSLNLKKQDTDTNLLANPRIRSRNREKAKILIGERVPNITTTLTSTGFATDSVTYVDVGLKLDVEPVVYPDGEVAIKLALEVSNIIKQIQTKSGSVAYEIGTRSAQTVLRLADGQNQVLAGLISDEDRKTTYKLPGAGDIPVLGRLFNSESDDKAKTEIVLSITPRILRNIARPPATLAEFDSGTEASIGQRLAVGASAQAGDERSSASSASARLSKDIASPAGSAAAGQQGVSLTWLGPREVRTGDTITLQVAAKSSVPVTDLPVVISFDPFALQHVGTREGDFMRSGGSPGQFASRQEPAGQITIAAAKPGDSGGATGTGVLATLSFVVVATEPRQTSVTMTSASAMGKGGEALAVRVPDPLQLQIAAKP